MYVSTMVTEHYSWIALGKTKKESENAIMEKWNDSDVREKMTVDELKDYYGMGTQFLKPGQCEYS